MLRIKFFLLCFLTYPCIKAQLFDKPVLYTTENGLTQNFCTSVIQDGSGFLWVGTEVGLNRFDGVSFKQLLSSDEFPLPANYITTLKKYDTSHIVVGTSEGGCIVNTRTLQVQKLLLPSFYKVVSEHRVSDILVDANKNLLVGTYSYIAVYNKQFQLIKIISHKKKYIDPIYFLRMFCTLDNGKQVAFITNMEEQCSFMLLNKDYSGYTPATNTNSRMEIKTFGLKKILVGCTQAGNKIYITISDNQYNLKAEKKHLQVYDEGIGQMKIYDIHPPGNSGYISGCIPLNDSMVVVSSYSGSPFLYNLRTQQSSYLYNDNKLWTTVWPHELGNNYYTTFDALWVTTSKGLYYLPYKPSGVTRLTNFDIFKNQVAEGYPITDILKVNGKKFISTFLGGCFTVDESISSITHQYSKERSFTNMHMGLNANACLSLYHYNGDTIWINSLGGVYSYNIKTNHYELLNIKGKPSVLDSSGSTYGHLIDTKQNVWYFHKAGISRYQPMTHSFVNFIGKIPGTTLLFKQLKMATEDEHGNIWLTGNVAGIIKYDYNKNNFVQVEKYFIPNDTSLSSSKLILSDKNGGLFINSSKGLMRYTINTRQSVLYLKANGAYTTDITWLALDKEKNLWVGTTTGLDKFDPQHQSFIHYSVPDGSLDNEIALIKLWDTATNQLVISSEKGGLCFLDPQKLSDNIVAPINRITEIDINKAAITLPQDKKLSLPYSSNNITIHYIGINFNKGNLNSYAYIMEGLDKNWNYVGNQTTTNYLHLSPGRYTFKVKSANHQGKWNEAYEKIEIEILPPFWQTWWFTVLAALSITGMIWWFFRRQRLRLKIKEAERLRIANQINNLKMAALRAQLNPHFIFNALNSIQYFVLDNNPFEASRYLSRFAKLFRMVLDNANHNFISIKNESDWLKLYTEIEALRFNNNFIFSFIIDKNIDINNTFIPSMLIQPHIENAILHGLGTKKKHGKLLVSFLKKNDQHIICTIEDNGIGRSGAKALQQQHYKMGESKGTKIIAERIGLLQSEFNLLATCQIEDLFDAEGNAAGTKVRLLLPTNNKIN